jgi:hypothetical protein
MLIRILNSEGVIKKNINVPIPLNEISNNVISTAGTIMAKLYIAILSGTGSSVQAFPNA